MTLPKMSGADEGAPTPLPTYLLDAVYAPDSPVNASAAVLWAYLYQRSRGRQISASFSTLAGETGQGERTVRRLVQKLKDAGAIRVRRSEVDGQESTEYVLAVEAPFTPWVDLSTSGWAYAISGPARNPVKIGYSVKPQQRLAELRTGSAVPLEVIWQAEGGAALERHLHQHFTDRRTHGEWFDFSDADAVSLITAAAQSFETPGGGQ